MMVPILELRVKVSSVLPGLDKTFRVDIVFLETKLDAKFSILFMGFNVWLKLRYKVLRIYFLHLCRSQIKHVNQISQITEPQKE